jgi:O-acetylserine/cysteine efflux transporter
VKPAHIALASGLTVIWGLNFVAMRFGLDVFPPLLFAALRFLIAGVPAFFLPRPKMPLRRVFAISLTIFVGQFGFLFPALQVGFPPGLSSLVLQVQAFFTVILAAIALRERPRAHNVAGMVVAFTGLALVAATVGTGGVTAMGLAMLLASSFSWASGNVILRGSPPVDMFALISWMSLLATLPLLGLSLGLEGVGAAGHALTHLTWRSALALLYVALPTTVLGYFIWGSLLKRYPAAQVAPFTLLVPITGTLSSSLILGETFGPIRLAGMALVMAGLVVNVFGGKLRRSRFPA